VTGSAVGYLDRQGLEALDARSAQSAVQDVALIAAPTVVIEDQVAQAVANERAAVALDLAAHVRVVPHHQIGPQVHRQVSRAPLELADLARAG